MQALLALADAAPHIDWRGDMRHLPAVGALPTPPAATAFLVVKQDDNGITFVITTAQGSSLATDVAATVQVVPRDIGAWAPPTSHDYESFSAQTDRPADAPTAAPF